MCPAAGQLGTWAVWGLPHCWVHHTFNYKVQKVWLGTGIGRKDIWKQLNLLSTRESSLSLQQTHLTQRIQRWAQSQETREDAWVKLWQEEETSQETSPNLHLQLLLGIVHIQRNSLPIGGHSLSFREVCVRPHTRFPSLCISRSNTWLCPQFSSHSFADSAFGNISGDDTAFHRYTVFCCVTVASVSNNTYPL